MRNSYFWGRFIMENRRSDSCRSDHVPQGAGPAEIQKLGIRLKTNFLGGMRNRFFLFEVKGSLLHKWDIWFQLSPPFLSGWRTSKGFSFSTPGGVRYTRSVERLAWELLRKPSLRLVGAEKITVCGEKSLLSQAAPASRYQACTFYELSRHCLFSGDQADIWGLEFWS